METAGIGLRPPFATELLQRQPALGFLEAHSENYFGNSPLRRQLLSLRDTYAISLHGVGLSLGRADGLDNHHLQQLKRLVDDVDPIIVSEHLAWSAYRHRHLPDLLPLPYTREALTVFCDHIDRMQQVLGRTILVENPSNYLAFRSMDMNEAGFLNTLPERTGCRILLDINNLYISARNVGLDPLDYIDTLKPDAVGQYHLAGHIERVEEQDRVLIDSHNQPVADPVWSLFRQTLQRLGNKPTLIEWDSDFPPLDTLLDEASQATAVLQEAKTDVVA